MIKDIVQELQGLLDIWKGILCTTGGTLDCEYQNKSNWYNVNYEWNKHRRLRYCDLDETLERTMLDEKGYWKIVTHYYSDDAHKKLEFMIAPDGQNSQQVDRMRRISLQFGYRIRVGYTKGYAVFQALQSTVMRTLNYPLPAITISKDE